MSGESATPDPVEIARQMYLAAGRHDVDTLVGFAAPDAVWDISDQGFGTFEGVDAIRPFLEDWWGSYEHVAYQPEEIVRLRERVVLGIHTQVARLRGTSVDLRLRDAYVLLFEGGVVIRFTSYADVDRARSAAERLAEERG